MKIQPFGDSSLLVSFEEEISETTNQKVIALFQLLENKKGLCFQIPAYNSLTIGIDPKVWNLSDATIFIREQQALFPDISKKSRNQYIIPVCYEEDFAPDLNEISDYLKISPSQLISLHTAQSYRVFMLGFVAGFAYLGTLNPKLESPRKKNPRLKVPAGSVGLAGLQTGIYPTDAPGGWQIIGRTPLDIFNPKRDNPTLLNPGDLVSFRAISKEEFQIIRLKIETGIFQMEVAHA